MHSGRQYGLWWFAMVCGVGLRRYVPFDAIYAIALLNFLPVKTFPAKVARTCQFRTRIVEVRYTQSTAVVYPITAIV
mgnify:CR=1 FL=1